MARKATWQRHADPRSTPRGAIYHILHYVYIYINRSLSSPYKGGSYPYKRSGIIYPTVSINTVRVGLTHAYSINTVRVGRSDLDRPSRSDGHDIFETVHDGPFHRNRRSKQSDGYDFSPYIYTCSSSFLSIQARINQIDCQDTFLACFSRVLPLPLQFPRPRSGRNRDLVEK